MMTTFQQKSGFTLFEILTVLVILGIIATLGLPTLQAGLADSRIAGAATEIVASLEYARFAAMTTGAQTRVTIDASSNRILVEKYKISADLLGSETELDETAVEGGTFVTVTHPTSRGADYDISFASEERFQGVNIATSVFGAGNVVTFNASGAPSAGGAVTLSAGTRSLTITVDAVSGKVTTSG